MYYSTGPPDSCFGHPMALSDKQTLSKGRDPIGGKAKDSHHNKNKQTDPMRSYAQILKSDQTRDTFDLKSYSSDELGELTEGGKLFLQARDKHSVVVSTEQFLALQASFKDVAIALRGQFPESRGLRIRNVNPTTKYFEISFLTEAAREAALKKEFSYEGKRVMVSRTYPKDTTIIRVSVSNLPYDDEEELKAQMSKIFGQHGEILEMGLLHTVHGHFFTGRGFVTLNLIPGKEYAPLVPQIDSWEKGETLKVTYTGMQPTCSRCHVTDHVFGNCPVMRRQVKLCHVCKSPDHLQKACPEAWWNQRKKATKLSNAHTSAHQQKPLDKATAHTVPSTAVANESTSVTEKATKPFVTAIVPATPLDSNNKESSAPAEATVSKPLGDDDGKDVTASGEEVQNEELDAGVPEPDSSAVIHEQQNDNDTDYMTEDDDDDLDNTDINMEDAAKEATDSCLTLEEVLTKMRRQVRINRRKAKQLHKDSKDKDKASRSRSGGLASKKKASTKTASRK